jgi:hypothetical protein
MVAAWGAREARARGAGGGDGGVAAFELEGSHFWGHADAGRPDPPPRAPRANDCIRPCPPFLFAAPAPARSRPGPPSQTPSLVIPHPQGVFSQHRPGPARPRAARPRSPLTGSRSLFPRALAFVTTGGTFPGFNLAGPRPLFSFFLTLLRRLKWTPIFI